MLATVLQELLEGFGGTQHEFARACGLTPSTLSHLLSRDPHYGLGIVPCLRIAQVTQSDASRLLRAAGKDEVAALIETLYGPAAQRERRRDQRHDRIAPTETRLIRRLRGLDARTRRAFTTLIEHLAAGPVAESATMQPKRRSRRRLRQAS